MSSTSVFRDLPYMGVIHVVVEAIKLGYNQEDPEWSNLGQGQPEVGDLEGAPPRLDAISIPLSDHAYGPVEGLPELRERIAEHYNRLYRVGKDSKYTAENVVVAAGGRTSLTRVFASFDSVRLGYFTPDYTAYEDLLTTYQRIDPVLIELSADSNFSIELKDLTTRVREQSLDALLISNPCNPTGRFIRGEELAGWTALARDERCTVVFDEYYTHYNYDGSNRPASAAEFVEDVNQDPVILIDGLTKSFRYPGWRVGWIIAPKDLAKTFTCAGSFSDGGPPRPMQRAAFEVLEPQRADQETDALRVNFLKKRDLMVRRLGELGIPCPLEPEGTFYAFGQIAQLPAPLNDGVSFFKEALKYKVLTVPGEFFDVNPYKGRTERSPLAEFVRFSYGPPYEIVEQGLDNLELMLREHS